MVEWLKTLWLIFCFFGWSPQGSELNVCCLCLSFLGGSLQVTIQKPITWKMAALSQAFTTSRYVSFYFLGLWVTKQSDWISNILTFSSMLPAQQLIWMLTFCETLPLDRLSFAVLILGSVRKLEPLLKPPGIVQSCAHRGQSRWVGPFSADRFIFDEMRRQLEVRKCTLF